MDQLLKSTAGTIRLELHDADGVLADATGNVPVTVTDGAGATVVATNAAHAGTGLYDLALTPAQTASLDVYTATWTPTVAGQVNTYTTPFEVAGGLYFSVAEARAFRRSGSDFSDTAKFPTATIKGARALVEEDIEKVCGFAFVPRSRRVTVDGNGYWELLVPGAEGHPTLYLRRLVAATVDGVALSPSELASVQVYPEGRLVRTDTVWSWGWRNVELHVEHGFDQVPEDVKRASLLLMASRLLPTNIDDRTISFTDTLGTRQLAVAGRRNQPFGIPDVDAVVNRRTERPGGTG